MNKFYFYTETAFHHQGDMEYMKKLVLASKNAGVSGVKFQVLTKVDDFVSTRHSAYTDLASYCFTTEQWREIFRFTHEQGLEIIMMPLNIDAVQLVSEFPVRYLEIHSVSFNDTELHKHIKQSSIPLIIGVGGRTLDEIDHMREYFGSQLRVLMFGFQSFPSKLEDIKLGKIAYLKQRYPDLTLGYADHSSYDHEFAVLSNDYAYLLGARIFEKHITVTEGEERVDYSAAVSAEKIAESIRRLNFLQDSVILDDSDYQFFNEPELRYRNRQLICVARRRFNAGDKISESDIALKMIDSQGELFTIPTDVAGKVTTVEIEADMPFTKENIA